jgi:hypothetical protein
VIALITPKWLVGGCTSIASTVLSVNVGQFLEATRKPLAESEDLIKSFSGEEQYHCGHDYVRGRQFVCRVLCAEYRMVVFACSSLQNECSVACRYAEVPSRGI